MPEAALPNIVAPMLSDVISMNWASCNYCQNDVATESSFERLAGRAFAATGFA